MQNGSAKRSRYHSKPNHQPTNNHHWAATIAIDQNAAHRSCKVRKKDDAILILGVMNSKVVLQP